MIQSGILGQDTFSDLFRGLSQKRRQGVLEVQYPNKLSHIYFLNGRIVEIKEEGVNTLKECVEILKKGELLPKSFEITTEETYKDLFLSINNVTPVETNEFKEILQQRLLEKLYQVSRCENALYSFKLEMVEVDKELSPSISVGQILLDIVSLNSDKSFFFDNKSKEINIINNITFPVSAPEKFILNALKKHSFLSEVYEASMLSEYTFKESLTSLIDNGVIVFKGEIEEESSIEETLTANYDSDDNKSSAQIGEMIQVEGLFNGSPNSNGSNVKSAPPLANISMKLLVEPLVPKVTVWAILLSSLFLAFSFWAPFFR